LSITKERIDGYLKALNERGIEPDDSLTLYCKQGGMDYEEVEKALDQLMLLPNKPDAILANADKLTTSCLRYFKLKNIKVPEEIAVIGFQTLI